MGAESPTASRNRQTGAEPSNAAGASNARGGTANPRLFVAQPHGTAFTAQGSEFDPSSELA